LVAKRKTPERRAIVDDKSTGASVLDAKPKEGWENRAIALEKAKDWQGLLDHCRRWTKAEPDNDFAGKWFMVAICLIKTREEPDSLMAWNNLGSHYSAMGRYREALEAYRKAITLKDAPVLEAIAWSGLSETYAKLSLYREAIEAARQALRFCPNIGLAWNALGNAYAKLGRHKEAIDAYRESLRHSIGMSETMAEAWSGLALSYFQLGNRSAALEAINELKKYDPQKADQLLNVIIKP
jgi:tetratricopeptide (TPR) repeat protein